jgi:hypothetical protein
LCVVSTAKFHYAEKEEDEDRQNECHLDSGRAALGLLSHVSTFQIVEQGQLNGWWGFESPPPVRRLESCVLSRRQEGR